MPHVRISLAPGRSDEIKTELAKAVQKAIVDIAGAPPENVSVAIFDVGPDDWKKEVWDAQMIPDLDNTYLEAGYYYDDDAGNYVKKEEK